MVGACVAQCVMVHSNGGGGIKQGSRVRVRVGDPVSQPPVTDVLRGCMTYDNYGDYY